ncbi:MAG: NUDIX domain-containing protein [Trueperaceae bacterium]
MTPAPRQWKTGPADVVEGAGGVVVNSEGKILLIRNHNGTWVFPKGHVDPGETPLGAALREVAEEAGVECDCPDPEKRFVTNYINVRGESRRITWFVLRTEAVEPRMLEPQHPEGEFVAPSDALGRLSFPEDRELLERVMGSGR